MKSYSSREIIKVLVNDDWVQTRCNGDHHIFRHYVKKGKVIVPHPKKDLKIGTLKSILKQAQITLNGGEIMKKKKNWYSYIAIFNYEEDGINISFPDLPGCLSCADTDEEAIHNAKEAMGLYLYDAEMENEAFPVPSSLKTIELGKNDIPYLVDVFMPEVRATVKDAYVKKTLTLPARVAYKAEKAGVNFSKVLREALDEYLKDDETMLKAN